MKNILSIVGSIIGWLGVLICFVSGIMKLVGSYHLFDYETMTLFTVGIAMIATGCLAKFESK
ncbi:hypothetical protein [Chromatium okenii]|uniref:hypothetical protein n=1 Tax=Chromatium okenii TaxID=61644 RepID=UPI0026F09419|nr:hypothetical protein [Chromatium okenii]MBV5310282.1 hypothetical protein [Chromatium okenii]